LGVALALFIRLSSLSSASRNRETPREAASFTARLVYGTAVGAAGAGW
jgi:hypothetical protein